MILTNKQIATYLDSLGFKHSQKGFDYTIIAVKLVATDKHRYLGSMTTELYPTIAKNYGTTWGAVERNIRHSIHTCEDESIGALTNGEFLARTVNSFIYGDGDV